MKLSLEVYTVRRTFIVRVVLMFDENKTHGIMAIEAVCLQGVKSLTYAPNTPPPGPSEIKI